MQRFQNIKMTTSPSQQSSPYEVSSSTIITKRTFQPTKLFQESTVRNDNRYGFGDISLAKSGFYSSTSIPDSIVTGFGRGLGNLPEDRLRKIATDFINLYGSRGEIPINGIYRMQREAYEKSTQKPDFSD